MFLVPKRKNGFGPFSYKFFVCIRVGLKEKFERIYIHSITGFSNALFMYHVHCRQLDGITYLLDRPSEGFKAALPRRAPELVVDSKATSRSNFSSFSFPPGDGSMVLLVMG